MLNHWGKLLGVCFVLTVWLTQNAVATATVHPQQKQTQAKVAEHLLLGMTCTAVVAEFDPRSRYAGHLSRHWEVMDTITGTVLHFGGGQQSGSYCGAMQFASNMNYLTAESMMHDLQPAFTALSRGEKAENIDVRYAKKAMARYHHEKSPFASQANLIAAMRPAWQHKQSEIKQYIRLALQENSTAASHGKTPNRVAGSQSNARSNIAATSQVTVALEPQGRDNPSAASSSAGQGLKNGQHNAGAQAANKMAKRSLFGLEYDIKSYGADPFTEYDWSDALPLDGETDNTLPVDNEYPYTPGDQYPVDDGMGGDFDYPLPPRAWEGTDNGYSNDNDPGRDKDWQEAYDAFMALYTTPSPVYTYAQFTDNNSLKRNCIGSEQFCRESDLMWNKALNQAKKTDAQETPAYCQYFPWVNPAHCRSGA